jgi:hypothetical protein
VEEDLRQLDVRRGSSVLELNVVGRKVSTRLERERATAIEDENNELAIELLSYGSNILPGGENI